MKEELKPKPCWTVESGRSPLGETGDYSNWENLLFEGEVVASREDAEDDWFELIAERMNRPAPAPESRAVQALKDIRTVIRSKSGRVAPFHQAVEMIASRALASSPAPDAVERVRAVLVKESKRLYDSNCECGADGETLESGTGTVTCWGHEVIVAVSEALAAKKPDAGGGA